MYQLELTAINKILINKGFINIVINDLLKDSKLDIKRKALFTRIVYGVVENKILLDYQISFYLKKDSMSKEIKNLLRMGVYMILYMNLSNHHVVLEIVEMVKKFSPNYTSLFNGILRNITRNGEQEVYFDDLNRTLSVKYSYPISLITLLKKQYPNDFEDILQHDSETYNVYRINTLKTTVDFIKEDLKDYDIEIDGNALITKANLTNLNIFKKGFIVYQDLASQKVSEILNPTENTKILDMCSAPGSKAFHMAALTNNNAEITCCDIYEHKIKLINDMAKNLGVTCLKPTVCDSVMQTYEEPFDYVLLDAPCSGLGVMKHKVDLKYQFNMKDVEDIVVLQKALLGRASRNVKVGGTLVYSTCTINKMENEEMIKYFLKKHKEFKLLEVHQLLPTNKNDGFYIAKMIREN
jgi:16S rRNA (cytosine967-C5)-methyltransferase